MVHRCGACFACVLLKNPTPQAAPVARDRGLAQTYGMGFAEMKHVGWELGAFALICSPTSFAAEVRRWFRR